MAITFTPDLTSVSAPAAPEAPAAMPAPAPARSPVLQPLAPSPNNPAVAPAPVAPAQPRPVARPSTIPPLVPQPLFNPAHVQAENQAKNRLQQAQNAKFNQYYAGLSPDDRMQFSPTNAANPYHSTTNDIVMNGKHYGGNTPYTLDELEAEQRANALSHFNTNIAPTHPDLAPLRQGVDEATAARVAGMDISQYRAQQAALNPQPQFPTGPRVDGGLVQTGARVGPDGKVTAQYGTPKVAPAGKAEPKLTPEQTLAAEMKLLENEKYGQMTPTEQNAIRGRLGLEPLPEQGPAPGSLSKPAPAAKPEPAPKPGQPGYVKPPETDTEKFNRIKADYESEKQADVTKFGDAYSAWVNGGKKGPAPKHNFTQTLPEYRKAREAAEAPPATQPGTATQPAPTTQPAGNAGAPLIATHPDGRSVQFNPATGQWEPMKP